MANIKSAEKQHRQAEKAKARNRATKSKLRSTMKKTRAAISDGAAETSQELMSGTFSAIDKAAKKKVIKKNTANRLKSRLAAAVKRSAAAK